VLILAFDTATPAVTVALRDEDRVLAHESSVDARRHGELLAASIARVLGAAGASPGDLTAVAVGTGPGPYTGLRVGLVTAQAIGDALGVGVYGICTLDVIAAGAVEAVAGREFVVATDARRREVYWARYSPAGERLTDPAVGSPFPAGCPVAGEGAVLYPQMTAEPTGPRFPDAARLADLAARRAACGIIAPAMPLYLRRPDAAEPRPPKRVSA
jgi:tRNA threonylcarbamoyl adenosine modification protein YeaZ